MGGLEALSLKFALCPSSKIKFFNSYHYAICIITQMLLPPPPRKKKSRPATCPCVRCFGSGIRIASFSRRLAWVGFYEPDPCPCLQLHGLSQAKNFELKLYHLQCTQFQFVDCMLFGQVRSVFFRALSKDFSGKNG